MNVSSSNSQMSLEIEYLLGFLSDELSGLEDVQIRPVLPSGTRRSIDLHQDYDPEANDVHSRKGVRVRAGSREYFFPAQWVSSRQHDLIHSLASEVREYLQWRSR